jgi:hypothetical protein
VVGHRSPWPSYPGIAGDEAAGNLNIFNTNGARNSGALSWFSQKNQPNIWKKQKNSFSSGLKLFLFYDTMPYACVCQEASYLRVSEEVSTPKRGN